MAVPVVAQSARDFVRLGNRAYREGQYDKAETFYLKSLAKSPSFEAYYNLGNTYVMQEKDSTAFENYRKADSIGTNDALRRACNFHNMGNIWYAQGMGAMRQQGGDAVSAFQRAVDFYKSSLRCNPNDNETRYNLALAQYQLKKNKDNQQNGGQQGQNQQNQQDEQQQKQDEQKDKKQDENKQDQQQEQENKQKAEQKKEEMSDYAAERLLNSAQQDEKGVQHKVKNNQQHRRRSLEKDW